MLSFYQTCLLFRYGFTLHRRHHASLDPLCATGIWSARRPGWTRSILFPPYHRVPGTRRWCWRGPAHGSPPDRCARTRGLYRGEGARGAPNSADGRLIGSIPVRATVDLFPVLEPSYPSSSPPLDRVLPFDAGSVYHAMCMASIEGPHLTTRIVDHTDSRIHSRARPYDLPR